MLFTFIYIFIVSFMHLRIYFIAIFIYYIVLFMYSILP